MLEERLALLEGGEACLASPGHGGDVYQPFRDAQQSDRVVASRALFGACFAVINDISPRWGISREFVDGTDLDQWRAVLPSGGYCLS